MGFEAAIASAKVRAKLKEWAIAVVMKAYEDLLAGRPLPPGVRPEDIYSLAIGVVKSLIGTAEQIRPVPGGRRLGAKATPSEVVPENGDPPHGAGGDVFAKIREATK